MFAFSDDHLKRYEFFCFSGSGLPSGEEQYFSQFGDRHASVFMQSKAQFFYVFHRGAAGTMKCCKVCLIFADHSTVPSPQDAVDNDEHVVRVVQVTPISAIMATITTIVINIAYEECNQ